MIFLILILWVAISEQRFAEVQPEVATKSELVTRTSVPLMERTEFSPTTFKIHEESNAQSTQTLPDVTEQFKLNRPEVTTQTTSNKPEVTAEPGVISEPVTKPATRPSKANQLSRKFLRGARPDYNEDGTVNVFGQYIGRGFT